MFGGLAGFGFDMLGRLGGNLSDTYGTGEKLRDVQRKEANEDFLERERMGIQARVEGFKAAGLHPVMATSYQGGNSPTQIVGGSTQPRGSYHVSEKPDPSIDRINAANARRAEAEADLAELTAHNAYRALATQPGQPTPVAPGTGGINGPTSFRNVSPGGLKPGVELRADQVTAGAGGLTAGTHPGMTDYEMPGGGLWTLPSNNASQALEDLELLKYLAIFQANKGKLASWLIDLLPQRNRTNELEIERLRRRFPPKGTPGKWPPRMHGGYVK